ncbi:MAG TPA: hypothetical protein VNZ52_17190 [Candidatus Thermoplasmatota archaeon]|nr:hypothetical protein [Candidatus Thermoplasmatota archaeon]
MHGEAGDTASIIEPRSLRLGRIYYLHPRSYFSLGADLWTVEEVDEQVVGTLSAVLPYRPHEITRPVVLWIGVVVVLLVGLFVVLLLIDTPT